MRPEPFRIFSPSRTDLAMWLPTLDGFHFFDRSGSFLHQDPVPTVWTAYAAVFVINLYGLLASGALIGHLLHYL
jgi:hypothetical protein